MSGLIDRNSVSKDSDRRRSITFPANGMEFGTLRKGIVRVCNDFAATSGNWVAESILVEVSKSGGNFETFRLWKNVTFPPGKSSSVTFRGDHDIHDRPTIARPSANNDPILGLSELKWAPEGYAPASPSVLTA